MWTAEGRSAISTVARAWSTKCAQFRRYCRQCRHLPSWIRVNIVAASQAIIALSYTMAVTSGIKLSRRNDQPWGFRLSGGVDFTFPLTVVRVAIGSLAHTAGLRAGDVIVELNGEPISQLTHVQVHDKLVTAGDDLLLSVIRNYEIARQQQQQQQEQ